MRKFTIAPNGVRRKVFFPVLAKGNVSQAKRLAHMVRTRGTLRSSHTYGKGSFRSRLSKEQDFQQIGRATRPHRHGGASVFSTEHTESNGEKMGWEKPSRS
jgi:hypothetical protein